GRQYRFLAKISGGTPAAPSPKRYGAPGLRSRSRVGGVGSATAAAIRSEKVGLPTEARCSARVGLPTVAFRFAKAGPPTVAFRFAKVGSSGSRGPTKK